MRKYSAASKKLEKLHGLLVVIGGWIILVCLPPSLIVILITGSAGDRLKALLLAPILVVLAIIAIRGGRRWMRKGY